MTKLTNTNLPPLLNIYLKRVRTWYAEDAVPKTKSSGKLFLLTFVEHSQLIGSIIAVNTRNKLIISLFL